MIGRSGSHHSTGRSFCTCRPSYLFKSIGRSHKVKGQSHASRIALGRSNQINKKIEWTINQAPSPSHSSINQSRIAGGKRPARTASTSVEGQGHGLRRLGGRPRQGPQRRGRQHRHARFPVQRGSSSSYCVAQQATHPPAAQRKPHQRRHIRRRQQPCHPPSRSTARGLVAIRSPLELPPPP